MLFPFPSLIMKPAILQSFFESIEGNYMRDIIGNKFGKWTVLSYKGRNKKSEQIYECKCDCGTIKDHTFSILHSNLSTQCKTCFVKELNKVPDLIGKSFGSWHVIGKEKNIDRNEWFFTCICVCGTTRNIAGHQLKSGSTTKCHRCRVKTHGMSYTVEFKIWTGMLRRCLNSKFKAYKYYGGRGITVCERWRKFQNFFEDMGNRPPMLQIDRINNDGNYEPGNCRWVTSRENNANRKYSTTKKGN